MEETMKNEKRILKGRIILGVISVALNVVLMCSLIFVVGLSIQRKDEGAAAAAEETVIESVAVSGKTEKKTSWEPSEGETPLPKPMNNVSDDGIITVKQKKHEYKGLDVMILDVTNNTAKNYTLTINAMYKNAAGQVFKTEQRVFEGFPAGYRTYFVFREGLKFHDFTYQIAVEEYTERPYAAYFDAGNNIVCRTHWGHVDERGQFIIPIGKEQVEYFPREVMIDAQITDNLLYPCEKPLSVTADFVLFNDLGELIYIGDARLSVNGAENEEQRLGEYAAVAFPPITTGIPAGDVQPGAENVFFYPLPEEYKTLTGFLAVKEVYPKYEKKSAFPDTGEKYYRYP